jgi:alanine racemase
MRTWIELSESAFSHNVKTVSTLLPPGAGLAMVVKANGYGHGVLEIALMAEKEQRIDWLCTAGIHEALYLRRNGITKNILVMAYDDASIPEALCSGISLTVYDERSLQAISAVADTVQQTAYVHVKIDTGLARLGIDKQESYAFIDRVSHYKNINLQGIFTHLADTNNEDLHFTYQQLSYFKEIVQRLEVGGVSLPYVHVLASGLLFLHEFSYNLVRVGTALYGLWKSAQQRSRFLLHDPSCSLMPLMRWFSYIEAIRWLGNRKQAMIPVGFYDGYAQQLEGRGYIAVLGVYAPVIAVHSSYLYIDITCIENATMGTLVCMLGGNELVSATHIAALLGTINLEVTARINKTIVRKVVN